VTFFYCINLINYYLDDLFGQCWNGEGSIRKAFVLQNSIDGLTNNKLIALEYTIDFLNRYQLEWKDYMTQCILLNILTDHNYQLDRYYLELFYNDCLEKDKYLDELIIKKQENNIYRRQINRNKSTNFFLFEFYILILFFLIEFYYNDPYTPIIKSEKFYPNLENSLGIPLHIQFNGNSRLSSFIEDEPEEEFYIDDDDIVLHRKPTKLVAEESIMSN